MDNSDAAVPSSARRLFLRGAALAAATPILTEAHLAFAAQTSPSGMALHGQGAGMPADGAVLINANENPLGPSKGAIAAISNIAPTGGRYDLHGETAKLAQSFAAQHGLKSNYVAVYAGSSEPLHYSVLAFTSPTRSFVTADPSYEAGMFAARTSGAKVVKVPLTAAYAHDVKAMVAADPNAGVIYICNPNNPTGTITSKADIAWALENKPKGSILLVDEAYIHLSDAEDVLDMAAADKDLIILRTFSKIYGMAGIRCGLGHRSARSSGQAAALSGQNAMPITALGRRPRLYRRSGSDPRRARRWIGDTRRETVAWLNANGYKVIGDPQTNCFMIDTGRSGHGVFAAMVKQNVYIGRSWPIWPNAVRVTVGTQAEMDKFKLAFKSVMSQPAMATNLLAGPRAEPSFPHFS